MLKTIALLEVEIKRIKNIARVFRAKAARLSCETVEWFDLFARAKYREEVVRRLQVILDVLEREYNES